ncbi:MAG: tRNA glutamyl-Q(34) synthetase GluQRS [Steroidobacteraceae bacterium]
MKHRSGASAARNSTAIATTGIGNPSGRGLCGRFAPTPSGPLHLGSLLAATGSYLSVRSRGGRWLLRIDDLDRKRCMPDLATQFPAALEAFGFEWDGSVNFQSDRIDTYRDALAALRSADLCYPCRCSRSTITAALAADPAAEPVYPGTCRDRALAGSGPHALRFRIAAGQAAVEFADIFQGMIRQDCRPEAGDFVIQRRDGPFAYHLAVVVDDERQRVTEVVRGADLLSCTPRQILLQRALGYQTPQYGHLPVLAEPDGRKLAKSRRALPLEPRDASRQLWQVLNWLEQSPPTTLAQAPVREIWSWAIAHWRPERLAGRSERRLEAENPT